MMPFDPLRRSRSALVIAGYVVLAVSMFGAGCSDGHNSPRASSSTPSSSPPVSPSGPQLRRYPLDQLKQQPCLSLDARDLAALGAAGQGKEESGRSGKSCLWKLAGQNVTLDLDVPLSYAKTMTKHGRVSQVPVGHHTAVQSEFQHICFIFVAVNDPEHPVGTTTIPELGAPQEGACQAGASVAAAALTHVE
ncbi:DUF3558 family protein [Actinomadura opuntiae]|uniref:DUF3558 family protein n=1 Tax=Actinomadura sp. OS1-43 TaxID=604315 RepID=UPI00255B2339|nr:DUF3558 family protein [Actinomadura sp. OS1-43]MDL4818542.1 DUF3558 family protein [Actinomadura sp. OS1-43]